MLYVVTCIFNPRGFKSRYTLYRDFAPYIEYCGAKLLTVEVAFDGRPFEVTTPGNPWNLQLRTNHELWHKERALNLGIQHLLKLDPNAKYVAWIDADVTFTNPHWVEDTIKALHHYCVIQLFSQAQNLLPNYEMQWSCSSRFHTYCTKKGYHQRPPKHLKYISGGHPGLAWAARIETLDQLGGLFDKSITGSGDTYMANALSGDVIFNSKPGMSEGFRKALLIWQDACDRHVKKNVGFIWGACLHYWHGKSSKRGYDKRWDITSFHQYDPFEDIKVGVNGLYQFVGNKKELEYDLRLSFSERDEDSTAV